MTGVPKKENTFVKKKKKNYINKGKKKKHEDKLMTYRS